MRYSIPLIIFLIGMLLPVLGFAQGDSINAFEVDLTEILNNLENQVGDVGSSNPEISISENPSKGLNLLDRVFNVSDGALSLFQGISSEVDKFLEENAGMGLGGFIKSLLVAVINILKVIAEILGSLLPIL